MTAQRRETLKPQRATPPRQLRRTRRPKTQVKGVDEADIVKADGTKLYVLHGRNF